MSQSSNNSENVDDASGRITYEPSSAWILDTSLGVYGPFNGTIHSTTQTNASATLQFTGTSISVTCLLWPTGANMSVTLDSEQVAIINTAVASLGLVVPKVVWSQDNLSGGTHSVVVAKLANDPTWVSTVPGDDQSHLSLDSFTIGGIGGSSVTTPSSSKTQSNSTPIIIGVVLGVVALITLIVATWYIRRRRLRNRSLLAISPIGDEGEKPSQSNDSPSLPSSSTQNVAPNAIQQRRNEKLSAHAEGVAAHGPNEGGTSDGRGRWRSSILGLPNGRVLRLNSVRNPGRSEPGPTAANTGNIIDINGRDGHRMSQDTSDTSLLRSPIPETASSQVLEHPTSPSTMPPSILAETTTPLPLTSSSPRTPPTSGEKSSPERHREPTLDEVQDSGTASFHTSALSTTSGSNGNGNNISTRALLRELVGLREQVRTLTQLHHTGGTSVVDHDEPPPEYEGRDASTDAGDDHE